MGTDRNTGAVQSIGAAAGAHAARPLFPRLISGVETAAPFAAGLILFGCGACHAGSQLGLQIPPGPLVGSSLPVTLLMTGAGAGIFLSACDVFRMRRALQRTQDESLRAKAQRDVAMLQVRRMRAQAEGLALMREIHRSTSIPQRAERLHRILTLLADLFEAREVSLFAAFDKGPGVYPAACLRITTKEELFVAFDMEEMTREPGPNGDGRQPAPRVARNAVIAREGCQLYVEGNLERASDPIARIQWRMGAQANHDALLRQDAADILEAALEKVDYGAKACAVAWQALERRRTVRIDPDSSHMPQQSGTHDNLILCVPLLADQRAVGVLRIRRSIDGFSGPEAEALEELLLESAKHIALALKKDDDDRKAITDVLTSLYIKRHFLMMLEQLRAESASTGKGFCLVLCDIDHFKRVNDSHGHLSGDMILRGVAGVLRKSLRTGDIAFRYGGEEMALLLPNSSIEAAEQSAERLRAAVAAAVFTGEKGQHVPITISLGVSQHQSGLTGESLISRADRALYASKQGGRNRVTRWSPTLPDPLEKKC